jgi:putative PIN family toxin of toxin-antitoxin system
MPNKPLRVIIDTNLWITSLIKKDQERLTALIFSKKIILVFSDELLLEFLTVCQRPKFKKYFSYFDTVSLLNTIEEYAEFINVKTVTNICRDTKDNFLLSLA